jgi:hypothetical protein
MNRRNTIYDCSIMEFPRIVNRAGNITPIEGLANLPFEIKRVFYIYDIPAGEDRGAHAHRECHQLIIAASGSFEVALNDGENKRTVSLNRPYLGIHVPPGIWAAEMGFSSGAICLVLTSHKYDPKDYIRDYSEFQKFCGLKKPTPLESDITDIDPENRVTYVDYK